MWQMWRTMVDGSESVKQTKLNVWRKFSSCSKLRSETASTVTLGLRF